MPHAQRSKVLGREWKTSGDRAWTLSGDASGLHVLTSDADEGYEWRTITTLAEPGLETDLWLGNGCLTGDGRTLAVTYAPRAWTNEAEISERGGFVATVDLRTGEVAKLPVRSSLAYFSPSCGTGPTAVVTQEGGDRYGSTRLFRIDVRSHRVAAPIEVEGQVTSAVPTPAGLVAADSGAVVSIDSRGRRRVVARTNGVPFDLSVGSGGSVAWVERRGEEDAVVRRTTTKAGATGSAVISTIARGKLTEVGLVGASNGDLAVLGDADPVGLIPPRVRFAQGTPSSTISSKAELVVSTPMRTTITSLAGDAGEDVRVHLDATVVETGKDLRFSATPVTPEVREGTHETQLTSGRDDAASSALNARGLVETERYCSVPRLDPGNQAMQPKPRQVEWAVDQAVRGVLTVSRPSNWKNLGMPAYTPQGLFPPIALTGGGNVPAQVYLGVLAQESNLWQAARSAIPGVTANPLIGNYYGIDYYDGDSGNDWAINWADADCGYGVSQMTDGMRLAGRERPGEVALPYQTQRAVALDFAANIAAGLRLLQGKWNETRNAGLVINNGNSAKIENWFYAVWAYNSGFHPQSLAGANNGAWGVGWLNNPVNPRYPANRTPFLDTTYADAAHPQDWPYPEKVMGWAGHPLEALESPNTLVAGYRPAWWNGDAISGPLNRARVKPPVNQFCDATNNCVPGGSFLPNDGSVLGEPAGPCAHKSSSGTYDLKCWYNKPSTWKSDCNYSCGNELLRFSPGYAYQEDGTAYPPRCTLAGLPANAKIIDDVPDGTPSVRPDCPRTWSNAGTLTLSYSPDASGKFPGKVDTHQIGGGFGGHFWFTHTRDSGPVGFTARWRMATSHTGPMQVLVALPDHGAHTRFATYVVKTAQGDRTRTVVQPGNGNRWVSLGAFMFDGVPEVELSSLTANGTGDEDIAVDAMAFVPISGTYKEQSAEAVAVFDEDQDIDTSNSTSWLSGHLAGRQSLHDWGMEKSTAIMVSPQCSAGVTTDCIGSALAQVSAEWKNQVSLAGTSPTNHPDGNSVGTWIGFAQKYTDRPTSLTRPAWFDDDGRYKIRTKATASYVVDSAGRIVDGSEWVEYANRTGNTHLPEFFRNLLAAVEQDYGIAPPDLTYTTVDLNAHDGASRTVDPIASGVMPGRAYAFMGKRPTLVDQTGAPSTTDARCVATLYTAGGSIGYRAFLGAQDGVPAERFDQWQNALGADPRVPDSVIDTFEDFKDMFLDPGSSPAWDSAAFSSAPPIWQELSVNFCSDGTVREVSGRPLLRASWMPDQYFYIGGRAATLSGASATSTDPVMRGDFQLFTRVPEPNNDYPLWANPFGPCGAATGRSGNPWGLSPATTQSAGSNPEGHFCLDASLPSDDRWSS